MLQNFIEKDKAAACSSVRNCIFQVLNITNLKGAFFMQISDSINTIHVAVDAALNDLLADDRLKIGVSRIERVYPLQRPCAGTFWQSEKILDSAPTIRFVALATLATTKRNFLHKCKGSLGQAHNMQIHASQKQNQPKFHNCIFFTGQLFLLFNVVTDCPVCLLLRLLVCEGRALWCSCCCVAGVGTRYHPHTAPT